MSNVPDFEMDDPLFHFYNKKDVEAFQTLVDKERLFARRIVKRSVRSIPRTPRNWS